jgi:hypothetical protein
MVAFTDESIRKLRHTPTPQRYRDPQLARHFLVVGPHSKTFFVQVERPKECGGRKTFKVRTGACPQHTVAEAREQAAIILRSVAAGEDVSAEAGKKARPAVRTLADCWAEFERHRKALVDEGARSAGTLQLYRIVYGKHLAPLGGETMRALADDPAPSAFARCTTASPRRRPTSRTGRCGCCARSTGMPARPTPRCDRTGDRRG